LISASRQSGIIYKAFCSTVYAVASFFTSGFDEQCAVEVVHCTGCYKITTVFSHAQTVVVCAGCSTVLCQPTGGKARLTEGWLSSGFAAWFHLVINQRGI